MHVWFLRTSSFKQNVHVKFYHTFGDYKHPIRSVQFFYPWQCWKPAQHKSILIFLFLGLNTYWNPLSKGSLTLINLFKKYSKWKGTVHFWSNFDEVVKCYVNSFLTLNHLLHPCLAQKSSARFHSISVAFWSRQGWQIL